jgi:hypothetical protein
MFGAWREDAAWYYLTRALKCTPNWVREARICSLVTVSTSHKVSRVNSAPSVRD